MWTWCRCAALCLIAACIPPQGGWPSQRGWQGSQHSTNTYDDDEYTSESPSTGEYDPAATGDYSEDSGYSGSPRNSGNSRNAGSSRNAGNSGNSRSGSGSGQWSCRAVGTYAPAGSDGRPDYSDSQKVDVTEWGRTQKEAGMAALKSCSGMLHLSTNSEIYPGSLVLDGCDVLTCSR